MKNFWGRFIASLIGGGSVLLIQALQNALIPVPGVTS